MGSKLAVLAAALIALSRPGHAEPKPGELVKQGLDAYKAGKYDDAAALLGQAYAVDARVETLFALAQAERLGGHCDKAIPRYRKLVNLSADLNIAKLVHDNLSLCEPIEPTPKPKLEPKPEPAPPPPRIIVRDVNHTDLATSSLYAGGALALGVSVGLFIASAASTNDATRARTFDDYHRLLDRSDRDRVLGYVAAGAGVGMIGFAIYRSVRRQPPSSTTELGLAPSPTGTMLFVSSRW